MQRQQAEIFTIKVGLDTFINHANSPNLFDAINDADYILLNSHFPISTSNFFTRCFQAVSVLNIVHEPGPFVGFGELRRTFEELYLPVRPHFLPFTSRLGLAQCLLYAATEEVTTARLNISLNLKDRMVRYVYGRLYQDVVPLMQVTQNSKAVQTCAKAIVSAMWTAGVIEDDAGDIEEQEQHDEEVEIGELIGILAQQFQADELRQSITNIYTDLRALSPTGFPINQDDVDNNPDNYWSMHVSILNYLESLQAPEPVQEQRSKPSNAWYAIKIKEIASTFRSAEYPFTQKTSKKLQSVFKSAIRHNSVFNPDQVSTFLQRRVPRAALEQLDHLITHTRNQIQSNSFVQDLFVQPRGTSRLFSVLPQHSYAAITTLEFEDPQDAAGLAQTHGKNMSKSKNRLLEGCARL